MEFTSKQDSLEGLDIPDNLSQVSHLDHQTPAPLNCPRCNSIKTKFCYYNNYNKSQPRHFCKSCKRHWTEGGTLRNVPVGGTRRNKRRKLCSESNTSSFDGVQQEQHQYHLGIGTNNVVDPTPTLPPLSNFAFTNLVPSDDLFSPFCFTNSSLFQSSNLDDIARLFEGTPDDLSNSRTTSHTITSEVINPSLELPPTSNLVDSTTGWSWDGLNTLVSSTDINLPGDAYQSEV